MEVSTANRRMTEWNAREYYQRSALQKWLADKSLTGLDLGGSERVLDIGCGDGKITAEIAERLPSGSVVGVDPSTAHDRLCPRALPCQPRQPALRGRRRDLPGVPRRLRSCRLVQRAPLGTGSASGAAAAFAKPCVPAAVLCCSSCRRVRGSHSRTSLRKHASGPRWSRYFTDYHRPYLTCRLRGVSAPGCELRVASRSPRRCTRGLGLRLAGGVRRFCRRDLRRMDTEYPAVERAEFIADVLDRYRRLGDGGDPPTPQSFTSTR